MFEKYLCWVMALFLLAGLGGCASSREYLRVDRTLDADTVFRSATMLPGYRYYYNGPKAEPLALLALDRHYVLNAKFWTPVTGGNKQLRDWITEFDRLKGKPDDIKHVTIDYRGSEILSPEHRRIGLIYSRYDWIVVWKGKENEVIVAPPEPSGGQQAPFLLRGLPGARGD